MSNQSLQYKHHNPILRFIDHLTRNGECWEWTSSRKDGYGLFWYKGKVRYAHRIAYEFFVGDITDNLQIDHLCRNRKCVNPSHLEAVTQQENYNRGLALFRTNLRQRTKKFCPFGHPYSETNTCISSKGHRSCRECRRIRKKFHLSTTRLTRQVEPYTVGLQ